MLQSLLPRSPITNAASSDTPPMSRPKRSADARDLTPSSSTAAAAAAAACDDDDDRLRKRKQLQLYPQLQPQQHVVVDVSQEHKNDNEYFSAGSSSRSSAVESRVLRLLGLLLHCAEAVAADRLSEARDILPEINELASPFGSSPERVAAYFADALGARILSSYLGVYSPLLHHRHHKPLITSHHNSIFNAFQVYNSISPLVKFSHFTSNQAIFQALDGEDRVHIIDLDIMQGLQWPGLFQILASRPLKLRSLRITGLGSSLELLEATGRRLSDFAAALGLPFEFQPVEGKIGDQSKAGGGGGGALARRDGREVAVVHWMHHCLYDVTGSDEAALSVIKNVIRPRLVTVVEQDLGRHGGDFLGRFVEALHYYSAVFDALGEGSRGEEEEEAERHDVERQLLGAEIRNIVAVGGPKRTGEVAVGRWGEEMRRAGFQQVSLAGGPAAAQANLLLGMRLPWKGYTLVEDAGCLKLGWKDLSLLTASAWKTGNSHDPAEGQEDRDHVQPQQHHHHHLS